MDEVQGYHYSLVVVVRNEYKLWIYSKYFVPSIRFLLTVHDVTSTHLTQLDILTHRYMKKWAAEVGRSTEMCACEMRHVTCDSMTNSNF